MTESEPAESRDLGTVIAGLLRRSPADAVRARGDSTVWDVRVPPLLSSLLGGRRRASAVEAVRDRILQCIEESREPILVTHQESPTEHDLPGAWTPLDPSWYRLPEDVDLRSREVRGWLRVGGWTMLQAAEPPRWNARMLRRAPAEIVAWMRSRRVRVLVDSFLDDLEWTVAVDPDAT